MKPIRPQKALAAMALVLTAASAHADTYSQDFDFPDGTTGFGLLDGTFFGSNNGVCQVIGNRGRITDATVGGTRSSFRMPPVIDSHLGWTLTFDMEFADIPGGNPPADGWSISYGDIPAFPTGPASGHGDAEEGFGGGVDHISYEVDTWMNFDLEQGLNIAVNQVDIPGGFLNGPPINDGDTAIGTVTITWDPYETSFITTGLVTNAAFANLVHTHVADKRHSFVFSARTGGATEDLFIDNVLINTGVQKDTDGDGLADGWEINVSLTDPNLADTGATGTPDGQKDPDGDGLLNVDEQRLCSDPFNTDSDGDTTPDGTDQLPADPLYTIDADGDYVADGPGDPDNCPTIPNIDQFDADGDGDGDACDNDSDNDGINDTDELAGTFGPATNPLVADTDGDGIDDGDELFDSGPLDTDGFITNPTNTDTDGDGFDDGAEVAASSDPTDPGSIPAATLLLYYPFDIKSGTTVANDGTLATDGTLSGTDDGGGFYTNGCDQNYGLGLQLNGQGSNDVFVDSGITAQALGFQDRSASFMAWVRLDTTNGDNMVFGNLPNPSIHYGVRGDRMHMGSWGGDVGGSVVIPTGTWVHLAWVQDGPNGLLYRDGTLEQTAGYGISGDTALKNILIGRSDNGASSFDGVIDEVKVFDRPLLQSEIVAEMAAPVQPDTDGDGLPDWWEICFGYDETMQDSDMNGTLDGDEDPDADGLNNQGEHDNQTDPNDPDADGDTLLDGAEIAAGTDPANPDTDGDGLNDNVETNNGPGSFVSLSDTGTNPLDPNTDGDGIADGPEATLADFGAPRDPTVADDPLPSRFYKQDFDVFPNGFTELGDGSSFAGNAIVNAGALQLTSNTNGNIAAFHMPALIDASRGFIAKFDYRIFDNTANPPADGWSFSSGAIPAGTLSTQAEEGWPGVPDVISFEMDTWEVGSGEVGPAIAYDGVDLPGAFTNGDILADEGDVSGTACVFVTPTNVTFVTTGADTNATFECIDVSGTTYVPLDSHTYAFAARTGGANEEVIIDNLCIISNCPPLVDWESFYFGGPVGFGDDDDGDTIENGAEFGFGLDPTVSDGSGLSVVSPTCFTRGIPVTNIEATGGAPDFTVRYVARTDGSVTYTVQFSHNLSDWEDSTATPDVIADDGSGYQVCELPYPFFLSTGRKARFFRVVVAQVP